MKSGTKEADNRTRKDYILVAGVLAEAYRNAVHEMSFDGSKGYALNGIGCAATSLANAFAADNSRFDRDHFLAVVRGEKSLTSRPAKKVGV